MSVTSPHQGWTGSLPNSHAAPHGHSSGTARPDCACCLFYSAWHPGFERISLNSHSACGIASCRPRNQPSARSRFPRATAGSFPEMGNLAMIVCFSGATPPNFAVAPGFDEERLCKRALRLRFVQTHRARPNPEAVFNSSASRSARISPKIEIEFRAQEGSGNE